MARLPSHPSRSAAAPPLPPLVFAVLLLLLPDLPIRSVEGFSTGAASSGPPFAVGRPSGVVVHIRRAWSSLPCTPPICLSGFPSSPSSVRSDSGSSLRGADTETSEASVRPRRDEYGDDVRISAALVYIAVPLLSATLPLLLSLGLYVPLSIAKRLVLYAAAGSIVCAAAVRGSSDEAGFGSRLEALTSEVLPKPPTPTEDAKEEDDDGRFKELRSLDAVDPAAQSAALPAVVASSLAASVLLLQFQDGGRDAGGTTAAAFLERIRSIAPSLIQAPNVAVVALFARADVDRSLRAWLDGSDPSDGGGDDHREGGTLSAILTAAIVGAAYLAQPAFAWPFRNVASSALAAYVGRAAQINRLGPLLGALSLLVLYDVYSVGMALVDLGGATMAARDATASAGATVTAAGSSAMGAVALSKAGMGTTGASSSAWQPGLLEVRLGGRVTDLLGLGDAVFPSLLSIFALRFDRRRREMSSSMGDDDDDVSTPYFAASLVGFAAGCVACEYAPGIGSAGLPALLFIVPSMLSAVLGLAVARGEAGDMWEFDPTTTTSASSKEDLSNGNK